MPQEDTSQDRAPNLIDTFLATTKHGFLPIEFATNLAASFMQSDKGPYYCLENFVNDVKKRRGKGLNDYEKQSLLVLSYHVLLRCRSFSRSVDSHDSPKIKKFVTNSGLSRPRISREQCQKMEPTLLHYTIEACLELGSLISAFEIIENCGWLSKKKEGSADNVSQDVKMLCLRLALTKIIEHLKTARTEAALSQAISVVVALISLEQKSEKLSEPLNTLLSTAVDMKALDTIIGLIDLFFRNPSILPVYGNLRKTVILLERERRSSRYLLEGAVKAARLGISSGLYPKQAAFNQSSSGALALWTCLEEGEIFLLLSAYLADLQNAALNHKRSLDNGLVICLSERPRSNKLNSVFSGVADPKEARARLASVLRDRLRPPLVWTEIDKNLFQISSESLKNFFNPDGEAIYEREMHESRFYGQESSSTINRASVAMEDEFRNQQYQRHFEYDAPVETSYYQATDELARQQEAILLHSNRIDNPDDHYNLHDNQYFNESSIPLIEENYSQGDHVLIGDDMILVDEEQETHELELRSRTVKPLFGDLKPQSKVEEDQYYGDRSTHFKTSEVARDNRQSGLLGSCPDSFKSQSRSLLGPPPDSEQSVTYLEASKSDRQGLLPPPLLTKPFLMEKPHSRDQIDHLESYSTGNRELTDRFSNYADTVEEEYIDQDYRHIQGEDDQWLADDREEYNRHKEPILGRGLMATSDRSFEHDVGSLSPQNGMQRERHKSREIVAQNQRSEGERTQFWNTSIQSKQIADTSSFSEQPDDYGHLDQKSLRLQSGSIYDDGVSHNNSYGYSEIESGNEYQLFLESESLNTRKSFSQRREFSQEEDYSKKVDEYYDEEFTQHDDYSYQQHSDSNICSLEVPLGREGRNVGTRRVVLGRHGQQDLKIQVGQAREPNGARGQKRSLLGAPDLSTNLPDNYPSESKKPLLRAVDHRSDAPSISHSSIKPLMNFDVLKRSDNKTGNKFIDPDCSYESAQYSETGRRTLLPNQTNEWRQNAVSSESYEDRQNEHRRQSLAPSYDRNASQSRGTSAHYGRDIPSMLEKVQKPYDRNLQASNQNMDRYSSKQALHDQDVTFFDDNQTIGARKETGFKADFSSNAAYTQRGNTGYESDTIQSLQQSTNDSRIKHLIQDAASNRLQFHLRQGHLRGGNHVAFINQLVNEFWLIHGRYVTITPRGSLTDNTFQLVMDFVDKNI